MIYILAGSGKEYRAFLKRFALRKEHFPRATAVHHLPPDGKKCGIAYLSLPGFTKTAAQSGGYVVFQELLKVDAVNVVDLIGNFLRWKRVRWNPGNREG